MQFNFAPPAINWLPIMPMTIVAVTGMIALVMDMFRGNKSNQSIAGVSILGLCLALVALLRFAGNEITTFGGMVQVDRLAVVGQFVTVLSALLVIIFSEKYLSEKKISFGEFYPLILWATFGGMIMSSTQNLLVLFIGIEVLSISLYVLAGLSRGEQKSEESALKYFLLGAFATGFLLYGIAFFYGGSGSLHLPDFAAAWTKGDQSSRVCLSLGVAFLTIGLGFKCSLVPFHQWTPDVYQGAPTNIAAFMATGGKAGAFIAMWHFAMSTYVIREVTVPVFAVLAVLTMTVGNVMAFIQKDLKRLLGYSSIANAGYVMVAIAAATSTRQSYENLSYYILGYALTTVGAFAVVSLTARDGVEATTIDDLKGLHQRAPLAAGALVIFVFSMIGLPLTAGFLGKFLLISSAIQANMAWLAIALVLNSIFGAVYYFSMVKAAYTAPEGFESKPFQLDRALRATFIVCIVGVIGTVIFYPQVMNAIGFN